jgi:short-subunit dehydrogenase
MKDTADTAGGVVVIFGGRSEIGVELATRLAPGSTVVLAARGADRLVEQIAAVRAAVFAAVGEALRAACPAAALWA